MRPTIPPLLACAIAGLLAGCGGEAPPAEALAPATAVVPPREAAPGPLPAVAATVAPAGAPLVAAAAPAPLAFPARAILHRGFAQTLERRTEARIRFVDGRPVPYVEHLRQEPVPGDPGWVRTHTRRDPELGDPADAADQRLRWSDGAVTHWRFETPAAMPRHLWLGSNPTPVPERAFADGAYRELGRGAWSDLQPRPSAASGRVLWRVVPAGVERAAVCLKAQFQLGPDHWVDVGRELCHVGDADGRTDPAGWPFHPQ